MAANPASARPHESPAGSDTGSAGGDSDVLVLLTRQHRRLEALLDAALDGEGAGGEGGTEGGTDGARGTDGPGAAAARGDLDDAARAPGLRLAAAMRAADELAVHIAAEETVFYPAVRAERTEDILLESLEEHLSLKRLVADLLTMPSGDDDAAAVEAKLKVLREQTAHHHREEEVELFPKVDRLLGPARRRELGAQVAAHEAKLRERGAPREALARQTDAAAPLT